MNSGEQRLLFRLVISVLLYAGCQSNTHAPVLSPPPAPVLTTVQATSTHRIQVDWTFGNASIDGFYIERNNGRDTLVAQVASASGSSRTYADTMLQAATRYIYRIRAYRGTYLSEATVEMSATTYPLAPTAPSGLTSTLQNGNNIALAWLYSTTAIVDSFQIERRAGQNGYVVLTTVDSTTRNFLDTGLVLTTSFTYRVRAFNISGASSYSNEAGINPSSLPPATPSNLRLIASTPGLVQIAWHNNANDITGFWIQRRTVGPDTFRVIGHAYPLDSNYYDGSVGRLTTYEYRVFTYNVNGNSGYSNAVSVTTTETLPAVPTLHQVTALSPTSVLVTWQCNTVNVDSFRLQKKVGVNGTYNFACWIPQASDTSYVDTNCAPLTVYGYKLCSMNRIGVSAYSNDDTTSTPDYLPAAPSDLTARALSNSRVTLYWTDHSTNEIGFTVERETGVNGTFLPVGQVLAHLHSWDDNGLSNSTIYGFRVYARGTAGNSPPTNIAFALTNAPAAELGNYPTNGIPRAIVLRESMAYLAVDTAGLQVLNVLLANNVRPVSSLSLPGGTYDISLVNDTAYCATSSGIKIVSMGNPSQPQYVSEYGLPGQGRSITVVNHLAYLACGSGGLQIVRVYNPNLMSTAGGYQLSDISATAEQVVVSGNYAYVAYGWGGAYIMDVSVPSATQIVGSMLLTDQQAEGIAVSNNIAAVAYGYGGLHFYNVSDPAHPAELSSVPTSDFTTRVVIAGNYAIAAASGAGIVMVNIANPATPFFAGSFQTPSRATNLTVVGNVAYVTDLDTGLRIISMDLP